MVYKILGMITLSFSLVFVSCVGKTKSSKNQIDSTKTTDSTTKINTIGKEVIFVDTIFNKSSHLMVTSTFDGKQFNYIKVLLVDKDTLIYKNMSVPDTTVEKLIREKDAGADFVYFMTLRSGVVTNGQSLIGFRESNDQLSIITIDGKETLNISGCSFNYSKRKLITNCDIRDSIVSITYQQQGETSLVRKK